MGWPDGGSSGVSPTAAPEQHPPLPTPPPGPPDASTLLHAPQAPRRPRPALPEVGANQLFWLALAAVLGNLALRTGVATISATAAVLVVAFVLLRPSLRGRLPAQAFAAAAVCFAVLLPLRASSWLTFLNASAAALCLVLAAVFVRPLPSGTGTRAILAAVGRTLRFRYFGSLLRSALAPLRPTGSHRLIPLIRGVAIAAVPVLILGALLASADEVFAQALSPDADPTSLFQHSFLTLFVLCCVAGLIAMMAKPASEAFVEVRPLGATEALIVLASVGGLYGAFVVVQALGVLGHTDGLLAEQGLTHAEYARSGFFQLLWVAALTVVLLGTIRVFVRDQSLPLDQAVRCAGAVVAALTIVIVAVAIVRLGLYTDEFGQTTLRWYCTAFAWMLGLGFVVLAAGHLRRFERFVPGLVLGLAGATLVAVNVMNPEARVVEHNLARTDAPVALDASYLIDLSPDAWPAILENAPLVARNLSPDLNLQDLCQSAAQPAGYGVFGFNLASARVQC